MSLVEGAKAVPPRRRTDRAVPRRDKSEKVPEAEECFHKAIEVARRQRAKSLELRASTSLARLWQKEGKKTEARQMLAEVYNWFTEGFDTADLQEAKAFLQELEGKTTAHSKKGKSIKKQSALTTKRPPLREHKHRHLRKN